MNRVTVAPCFISRAGNFVVSTSFEKRCEILIGEGVRDGDIAELVKHLPILLGQKFAEPFAAGISHLFRQPHAGDMQPAPVQIGAAENDIITEGGRPGGDSRQVQGTQ